MASFRNELSSSQRSLDLELKIDPGFVHQRKIQTIGGQGVMDIVDDLIRQLPSEIPEWQKIVRIDHIYSDIFLQFCKAIGIKTLEEILYNRNGHLFCSTVITEPCENFWEIGRAKIAIKTNLEHSIKPFLEFSTSQVRADTLKSRLTEGGHEISVVGLYNRLNHDEIIFEPLIMGFPWLVDRENLSNFDTMWHHYDYYENYIEDFAEFNKVEGLEFDEDFSILSQIKEKAIKHAFAKILKDSVYKDWGGETSDFYSTHIHLYNKKRCSAAFMFKGPAKFAPMSLNSLGKNNDQIVRLSKEPCQILFVQHCHDILQPVRETLRAFAVQPGNPRRYCLIDGRDTLRLLKAYNLLDWAIENSKD